MRYLIEGFTLGLSTAGFCLAGCVPLLVPFFLSENRKWRGDALVLGEYLAGRLVAYLLFGLAVGWAGEQGRAWFQGRPAGVLLVVAAGMLLAYALGKNFPDAGLCRRLDRLKALRRYPLVVGFLLGINVCPPFLAGVSVMLAYGSVWRSVVFSAGFFAATTVFMLPFLFSSRLARFVKLAELAQAVALLTGLYFLIQGALMVVA